MKLLPNKNLLKSYVTNKRFGPYYFPVRFQNKILKQYCEEKNKIFSLSTGEITFGDNFIQLRSLIKNLKKGEGLVFISLYVLPKEKDFRSKILNSLAIKKIECHFIFENIKAQASDKVSVIITHRLYNLKFSDRIYVMDNGEIVEQGTFEELKANSRIFNALYEQQKV
jgi:sporadic carbohydrate cluster protein (TIGR04323 family)